MLNLNEFQPHSLIGCVECSTTLWDFGLAPRYSWDFRSSSGMLCGVSWQLVTDVSEQPIICPIFLSCLTLQDRTNRSSRKLGNQPPTYGTQRPRRAKPTLKLVSFHAGVT